MTVHHMYAGLIIYCGMIFLGMLAPALFADDPWLRWTARFISIMALMAAFACYIVRITRHPSKP